MKNQKEIHKYEGFKLISLYIQGNKLLSKSELNYNFIEPSDSQKSIYTTVIIGANGTGKSNLFRIIIELFKQLYDLKDGKKIRSIEGRFKLRFSVNGDVFEYKNFYENSLFANSVVTREKVAKHHLMRNGNLIDFKELQLPIAIVANSIMLTDKYPIYNDDKSFPIYKYLGVRNRPQQASTRSYVRKTVEFIVDQFDSDAFKDGLKRITKYLNIDESIEVIYFTINTPFFFNGNLDPVSFNDYFYKIGSDYGKKGKEPPYKYNEYKKISNNKVLISEICDFCKSIVPYLKKIDKSSGKWIGFDILSIEGSRAFKYNYEMLDLLRKLGILTVPDINLKRKDKFLLKESSSGEYHFFSTMVGLMATVKVNSLLFIDEPEISLHPNWQMKYLAFLREMFLDKEYASSHILVATHSHFLISDLKGDSSKIVGLKRNDAGIEMVDLPKDMNTYGWSAENVLLNVFGVATSRNFYIAERLSQIFKVAANSKHPDLSEYKVELLEWHNQLKASDPLHYTIEKLIERMGWQD